MTDAEIRWTSYVTKGLLGFSDRVIDSFVKGQANSVCKNLKLPLLYPEVDAEREDNLLYRSIKDHLPELTGMTSRDSMFVNNSTQYSKGAMNVDI